MATNLSKQTMDEITESIPELTVEVVQRVASIYQDSSGQHPALRLAFMAISDHFADNARSEGNRFEYRINHPSDDHQFTVTIDDPPYPQS